MPGNTISCSKQALTLIFSDIANAFIFESMISCCQNGTEHGIVKGIIFSRFFYGLNRGHLVTGVTKLLLEKGFATDHVSTTECEADQARKFLASLVLG